MVIPNHNAQGIMNIRSNFAGFYTPKMFEFVKPIFHCDAKLYGWVLLSHLTQKIVPLRYLTQKIYQHVGISCVRWHKLFRVTQCKTPNASQWNIGCFGYQTQNLRVGHVHFMLFVSISFALGSQCKRSFQWNMGLKQQQKKRLCQSIPDYNLMQTVQRNYKIKFLTEKRKLLDRCSFGSILGIQVSRPTAGRTVHETCWQ